MSSSSGPMFNSTISRSLADRSRESQREQTIAASQSSWRVFEGGTVSRGLGFIIAGGQEGPNAICILGTMLRSPSNGESRWADGVEVLYREVKAKS